MHKFVRNLLTEWRKIKLPFSGETLIVAVSGGADSVSLMLALEDLKKRKKLDLSFVIAHFNHDLRSDESRADAEFVRRLAEKLGFEFAVGLANSKFQISKKGNLEQNARTARYKFLIETAETNKAYGILTAHTINDQAETLLLNLIRGSGLAGLCGMKPVISNFRSQISNFQEKSPIPDPRSPIALVRPLLNWAKREDPENFCGEKGIEFRKDTMNDDLLFKRVRIRKVLIPVLKDFNPKIIETLARTASLLRMEKDLLENLAAINEESGVDFHNSEISLKELKKMPESVFYNLLRNWIKTQRGDLRGLGMKHFEAINRLALSRKSGQTVELPNGAIIVRENGKLRFKWQNPEKEGRIEKIDFEDKL